MPDAPPARPTAVAFDVIGTLFPLDPLREPLVALGLPPHALEIWFARTLRDGFALAASGSFRPFDVVATGTLEGLLAEHGRPPDPAGVSGVLSRLSNLPARPDAGAAMVRLRGRGIRVLALTNGSREKTGALLKGSGLGDFVERTVSIDDVKAWKPRAGVYRRAAEEVAVELADLGLIAAHAWDCHGARRAGLVTGWVSHPEALYSPAFEGPDVRGETLSDVAEAILRLPEEG
jgi:2-haloacid dehalogenase